MSPDFQVSHLVLRRPGGEVDEEEGTGQQTQDGHVEHEPEQVETHLLPQRPLSHALGEALLLQKELRHRQQGFVRIRNPLEILLQSEIKSILDFTMFTT